MKKFMKRSAILALALILAGVLISVTATSIVGAERIDEVVAQSTDGRVHMNLNPFSDAFGISVLENGVISNGSEVAVDFDSDYKIYTGDVEKFRLGSNVSELLMDVGNCELIWKPSDDENFYVEAKAAGKLQAYVEDEELFVKAAKKGMKKVAHNCKITLYVPEEYFFDRVVVSLGAGMLNLGKVYAKVVDLELGAGQIEMEYLKAEDCSIEVGMGEVQVQDMDVDTLDVEVGMGAVHLAGDIHEKAELECAMGQLELTVEGSEDDFNYEVNAAMGNLTIGKQSFSGLGSSRTVDNDADKNMQLDCSMGNLNVLFTR
ncbi:MAG: DUF4097 family beta strand repeat protein [Lachnospiraceae bacterium]|nr:DUF4097 family beta strand repeat protein [Lachnospiraceae bacterium]